MKKAPAKKMNCGGSVKKMAKGGKVAGCAKGGKVARGTGCATKGKSFKGEL